MSSHLTSGLISCVRDDGADDRIWHFVSALIQVRAPSVKSSLPITALCTSQVSWKSKWDAGLRSDVELRNQLAAGDLLRAEQARPGSEYGEMISRYIREGQIVPMEVTIKVRNIIRAAARCER